ncbi:MAG: transcriptional regulator [Candidatus Hydrogenedentales bacterium]|jgi:DNA-binding transcriptional ArsR family regulator
MAAKENTAKKARAEAGPNEPVEAIAFDRIIHERLRLAIVSALAVNASLSFSDLKRILKTTDGNLSVHTRKLEDAGYIACKKRFEGRVPKTEFQLTAQGRKALEKHLSHMEALIRRVREG